MLCSQGRHGPVQVVVVTDGSVAEVVVLVADWLVVVPAWLVVVTE